MAKRLKQAIAVGMICLPLILGAGCGKKEVEKVKGTIVKEGLTMYNSAWKSDVYRILVECEDGKKRMYSFQGQNAGEADFKYTLGDKVNLPKETGWTNSYLEVKIVE